MLLLYLFLKFSCVFESYIQCLRTETNKMHYKLSLKDLWNKRRNCMDLEGKRGKLER